MDWNAEVKARFDAAVAQTGGVVRTYVGNGSTMHAALNLQRDGRGLIFPRALCMRRSSLHMPGVATDQNRDVTCKRCIAALQKRSK